jgi:heme/copper-type cytochrome/quinol oxidase subunit 4
MLFFDFFYLKVFQFYKEASDDGPEFGGVCAVAGFQTFNLGTLRMIFGIFLEGKDQKINVVTAIATLFILITVYYFRYIQFEKNNYLNLEKKWNKLTAEKKKWYRYSLVFYGLISVILFFGTALYHYYVIKN